MSESKIRFGGSFSVPEKLTARPAEPEPTPTPIEPALLRVDDAARYLNVGRSKCYQLIRRGVLPSIKLDGARRIRKRDLDQLLDALVENQNQRTKG